ncbi:C-type mannose receptor 2-like [Toxotes jaculatrix]|uniref:C-type mannose receptor 2-like n=1 Tax=Toxotes jaculatrix TaxID=941984 RepID=UPI001B3AC08B|nr:C-type mannose receptor 2-like [Toxotes jaculatrix]XP_040895935.1 C-type mannose receptor 2-like [Toxotes jaculatrix]
MLETHRAALSVSHRRHSCTRDSKPTHWVRIVVMMMMMMKSSLSGAFLVLLLCSDVSGLQSVLLKFYTVVQEHKTWQDAQSFCRNGSPDYNDLATMTTDSDVSELNLYHPNTWIGLKRSSSDSGKTWSWSSGFSEYRNWKSKEPSNNEDCVTVLSGTKEMAARPCSDRFPFICYRDNLVLINDSKTWYEALDHCRALGLELVSVQPEPDREPNHEPDHKYMMAKITAANTEEVWTGLHFLGGDWLWINGADMLYSDLPVCPINGQHCGVLTKNNTKSIETRCCSEKRNFLCYK